MERRLGRRLADQIGGVAVGDPAQQPGKGMAVDGDVVDRVIRRGGRRRGGPGAVPTVGRRRSRPRMGVVVMAASMMRSSAVSSASCNHEAVVTGVRIGARTAIAGTVATAGDEAELSGDLHPGVAQDAGKTVDVEPADDVDPARRTVDRRVVDLLLGEPHGELGGGQFVVQGNRFSSVWLGA